MSEKLFQKIICFLIGHTEFWPDLSGTFMYCSRCDKERDDTIMTPKYKVRSAKSTRYYGNTEFINPTDWMPLPPPPTNTKEEE